MFSLRTLGFGTRFFSSGRASSNGPLRSVTIHDLEDTSDRQARTLKHLLKANHINNSILYSNNQFHNHAPHILGSAYILGANNEQLNKIYDLEHRSLEPWRESPGEVAQDDWRDFLGKKEYQKAYNDFFEDKLVHQGRDWRELLEDYLFSGPAPLANNLISGLAHPLIHLAYGYELASRAVSVEALAMTASCYNVQHKYLDDPSYTKPAPNPTEDLLELFGQAAKDKRLDSASVASNEYEFDLLFADEAREAALLEHWNAWDLKDPQTQMADAQKAAAALLVASTSGQKARYDFYLVHVLTSSHAVRILMPLLPEKWQAPLARQWWLFALSAFVRQGRQAIDPSIVANYDLKRRNWDFVVDRALNSRWAEDAHYVKACRALKVAAETWGDQDQFYVKAGVRFADTFDNWAF